LLQKYHPDDASVGVKLIMHTYSLEIAKMSIFLFINEETHGWA
jgi:hypothetical protein